MSLSRVSEPSDRVRSGRSQPRCIGRDHRVKVRPGMDRFGGQRSTQQAVPRYFLEEEHWIPDANTALMEDQLPLYSTFHGRLGERSCTKKRVEAGLRIRLHHDV